MSVVALALGLGAAPAAAQAVGAKGGGVFMSVVFDDPDLFDVKPHAGFLVGGFVTFLPDATIGLQAEALVSRWKVTFNDATDDTTTSLELPVLARIAAYRGDRLVIHGLGGVAINYLLAASEVVAGGDPTDVRAAFKAWGIAAVVGADAELNRRWIIGVRYLFGLTRVYEDPDDLAPARQQGFQVTVGYRLK